MLKVNIKYQRGNNKGPKQNFSKSIKHIFNLQGGLILHYPNFLPNMVHDIPYYNILTTALRDNGCLC